MVTRADDDNLVADEAPYSSREPGEPPGTIEDIPSAPPTVLDAFGYDDSDWTHREELDVADLSDLRDEWRVVWVNIDGVGDADLLEAVAEEFDFDDLFVEDVQNRPQRPKAVAHDERLYLLANMPHRIDGELVVEHVAVFLGDGFAVTFQQYPGDTLDPVRERIRRGLGRLREAPAPYLGYALLDTIVDSFFPILDEHDAELARIDDRILTTRDPGIVSDVHALKSELMTLERAARPQRDMVNTLLRNPGDFFSAETLHYLDDCRDHALQVAEVTEKHRDLSHHLLNTYVSVSSQRMTEVMKVLTIIATIFIPLTFIAGVYGMNFDPSASPWNMPELNWAYGYPMVLGLMASVALALVWYFARKGWLGATGD